MRRLVACSGVVAVGVWLAAGCSGSSGGGGFGDDGSDGGGIQPGSDGGTTGQDASFTDVGTITTDGSMSDTGTTTTKTIIYANTDTELYSMDPMTMAVTDIGAFSGMTACGSSTNTAITDLAVNSAGDVYVNTECAIYKAAVPATTGPVPLTLVTTISGTNDYYALAFAPAGVLGSTEALVAGDSNGELWYIDTSGASSAPQDLGGFGSDTTTGKAWELSGDLSFYVQGSTPAGVATIRYKTTGSTDNNDVLAGIDVTAMTANFNGHTNSASLNLGIYGTGSGFGDLFGVGIVGSDVYAFSRKHGSGSTAEAAQLVQIGSSGAGTSLQTFSSITEGWSGAGVTTSVTVTITPPPNPP
jgi:hypothetical protein